MAQIQKLESETLELKCSADKFYDVYRNNQYLLCKFCPENYKSVQVLEGDGKSVGTVRHWKWVQGDSPNVLSCDEKLKAVDDKNMSITFGVYDGDLMKSYESFDLILSVTPNKGRSIGSGPATQWRTQDFDSVGAKTTPI